MIKPIQRIVLVDTTKNLPLGDDFSRNSGAHDANTMRAVFASDASVFAQPQQATGAPSASAIQTVAGTTFTLSAGMRGFIQNLGTNPLFVKQGAGASPTSFNDELAGGSDLDDGTGASLEIDDFIGPVSVAGTSPRYIAWMVAVS